ncbi:uncharacterized protein AMSG_02479 [Thecamonas trahens ATCC 50062]|uniref:Uncharacterized protein n=1 Tax=Thecamonas trahens ATCC 50062 TaxID=461836 RepID=A0A0L0D516_THETB|nr:hypothetical protein AMSG_02479 [Thecamonas trahens ATCC 50062]KNC47462.1 hypothetical protein AMSG_02479 [Thecamonas trahens ATCC 50062]|eukprot:XP_013759398.1 hypothetical protein AMSG_02479 [Thecamonas trahens ATCC 50062]
MLGTDASALSSPLEPAVATVIRPQARTPAPAPAPVLNTRAAAALAREADRQRPPDMVRKAGRHSDVRNLWVLSPESMARAARQTSPAAAPSDAADRASIRGRLADGPQPRATSPVPTESRSPPRPRAAVPPADDSASAELAALRTAYAELEELYAASLSLNDALAAQLESRAPLEASLRGTIATLRAETARAEARNTALVEHIATLTAKLEAGSSS